MDTQTAGKLEYILSGTGATQDERNQIIDLMNEYAKKQAKVFSNGMLADSYLPSELIAMKEYFQEKCNNYQQGCKSQENIDAEAIIEKIEEQLKKMANNLR